MNKTAPPHAIVTECSPEDAAMNAWVEDVSVYLCLPADEDDVDVDGRNAGWRGAELNPVLLA